MMKKWIAVLGSPRRGKNTEKLMDYYAGELERQGRIVEKIVLSEINQNPCNGCESCTKNGVCCYNDDITKILDSITEIEGIILGSPSYNYNVTSYMKIFLDRLLSLFNFGNGSWDSKLDSKGIKGIIIGVCAGPNNSSMGFTIEGMKRVMVDHGVEVIIEENYFGTKRNPVERNEEIKNDIIKKMEEVFLTHSNMAK